MRRARLIILGLGLGAGIRWEIEQAVRLLPPQRLVLLPSDAQSCASALAGLAPLFPRGLPEYPAGSNARCQVWTVAAEAERIMCHSRLMADIYSGRLDALEQTWRAWADLGDGLTEGSVVYRAPLPVLR